MRSIHLFSLSNKLIFLNNNWQFWFFFLLEILMNIFQFGEIKIVICCVFLRATDLSKWNSIWLDLTWAMTSKTITTDFRSTSTGTWSMAVTPSENCTTTSTYQTTCKLKSKLKKKKTRYYSSQEIIKFKYNLYQILKDKACSFLHHELVFWL